MKFLIATEKGFSIVQGMILSGVLAGSALVATKMLSEQKKVQKSAETRDQIEDLHRVVYSALQNRKNCERTIFNAGVSAASNIVTAATVPIDTIVSDNAANPIVVKKFVSGTIDTTQLYMNGNVIVKDIFISGYNASSGTSTLSIIYERMAGASGANAEFKRTKDGYGAKDVRKNVTLRIQRDPFAAGKPFESCYATTSDSPTGTEDGNRNLARELCEEMNGNKDITDGDILKNGSGNLLAGQRMWVWDEASATCLPNAKCPDNEVYTGVDSTGDVKCRSIKDWGDFNNMLAPTQGTCTGPGKRARLKIINGTGTPGNPIKVAIECYTP